MDTDYPAVNFQQQCSTYIQGKLCLGNTAVYEYMFKVVVEINGI